MRILGLQLSTPGLSELKVVVLTMALAITLTGISIRYWGWDLAQASVAMFVAAGGASAFASGA